MANDNPITKRLTLQLVRKAVIRETRGKGEALYFHFYLGPLHFNVTVTVPFEGTKVSDAYVKISISPNDFWHIYKSVTPDEDKEDKDEFENPD